MSEMEAQSLMSALNGQQRAIGLRDAFVFGKHHFSSDFPIVLPESADYRLHIEGRPNETTVRNRNLARPALAQLKCGEPEYGRSW
jgi:hypothetical protein